MVASQSFEALWNDARGSGSSPAQTIAIGGLFANHRETLRNEKDAAGTPWLSVACADGSYDLVSKFWYKLIEPGLLDVNVLADQKGRTPLHHAAAAMDGEKVVELLQKVHKKKPAVDWKKQDKGNLWKEAP